MAATQSPLKTRVPWLTGRAAPMVSARAVQFVKERGATHSAAGAIVSQGWFDVSASRTAPAASPSAR